MWWPSPLDDIENFTAVHLFYGTLWVVSTALLYREPVCTHFNNFYTTKWSHLKYIYIYIYIYICPIYRADVRHYSVWVSVGVVLPCRGGCWVWSAAAWRQLSGSEQSPPARCSLIGPRHRQSNSGRSHWSCWTRDSEATSTPLCHRIRRIS